MNAKRRHSKQSANRAQACAAVTLTQMDSLCGLAKPSVISRLAW